jgi:hypothetical protein
LREQRVDYLVLPMWYEGELPNPYNVAYRLGLLENPAIDLEPVEELSSPQSTWGPGVAATLHAAPRQVVFRVRFTGDEGLVPAGVLGVGDRVDDAEGVLRARDRAVVQRSVDAFFGRGVMVRVSLTTRAPTASASPSHAWQVRVGPWGADVSPRDSPSLPADAARSFVMGYVRPYLDAHNVAGATLIALYAIARAERHWIDPRFPPAMPVVDTPQAMNDPFGSSWAWGFPSAVVVLAVGLVLSMRATRQGGMRNDSKLSRGSAESRPIAANGDPS